jgi:hypothetical protein
MPIRGEPEGDCWLPLPSRDIAKSLKSSMSLDIGGDKAFRALVRHFQAFIPILPKCGRSDPEDWQYPARLDTAAWKLAKIVTTAVDRELNAHFMPDLPATLDFNNPRWLFELVAVAIVQVEAEAREMAQEGDLLEKLVI